MQNNYNQALEIFSGKVFEDQQLTSISHCFYLIRLYIASLITSQIRFGEEIKEPSGKANLELFILLHLHIMCMLISWHVNLFFLSPVPPP